MSFKTLFVTAALAFLPVAGLAQGCNNGVQTGEDQAMSCIPGTQWDAAASACIPVVSS